jgi:hypothetical protein
VARIIVRHSARERTDDRVGAGTVTTRPLRVRIEGRLGAADLRRLEAACGPALEKKRLALELNLRKVSALDDSAAEFLAQLRERGATLLEP